MDQHKHHDTSVHSRMNMDNLQSGHPQPLITSNTTVAESISTLHSAEPERTSINIEQVPAPIHTSKFAAIRASKGFTLAVVTLALFIDITVYTIVIPSEFMLRYAPQEFSDFS